MINLAGKRVYLSEKQLEFLISMTDPVNAVEDDERDEIRAEIHEKLTK